MKILLTEREDGKGWEVTCGPGSVEELQRVRNGEIQAPTPIAVIHIMMRVAADLLSEQVARGAVPLGETPTIYVPQPGEVDLGGGS